MGSPFFGAVEIRNSHSLVVNAGALGMFLMLPSGIWHTGLIVYGKEYFFGGGLQSMPHEVFVQMHGGERPKEYIDLGFTDISQV